MEHLPTRRPPTRTTCAHALRCPLAALDSVCAITGVSGRQGHRENTMHSSLKGSLVAGLAIAAAQGALANSYTIVDLGDHREAVAINSDGVVAANRSDG